MGLVTGTADGTLYTIEEMFPIKSSAVSGSWTRCRSSAMAASMPTCLPDRAGSAGRDG
ncbi:MAG: hypothetical protein ACLUOF_07670 [Ruminococcus sp.]